MCRWLVKELFKGRRSVVFKARGLDGEVGECRAPWRDPAVGFDSAAVSASFEDTMLASLLFRRLPPDIPRRTFSCCVQWL